MGAVAHRQNGDMRPFWKARQKRQWCRIWKTGGDHLHALKQPRRPRYMFLICAPGISDSFPISSGTHLHNIETPNHAPREMVFAAAPA